MGILPQDVPATSSGCKLLDRGTFDLEVEGGERCTRSSAEGGEVELPAASSPWNRTLLDVGVEGSGLTIFVVMFVVGVTGDVDEDAVGTAQGDSTTIEEARDEGGCGSSGILEAWEGGQFGAQHSGSRSLACISLKLIS